MPAMSMTPEQVSTYIAKVGVIGAGTMGGGISMNFANVGIAVTIVEVKQEALDRGLGVIRKNYQNSADKGRFPQEEVGIRMGLLNGTLNRADLADCDLIIEAIFEDMAIKKEIFADLDKIAKPGASWPPTRPTSTSTKSPR
jgi:3-hydroxyacyl-CoA dehydrogenase